MKSARSSAPLRQKKSQSKNLEISFEASVSSVKNLKTLQETENLWKKICFDASFKTRGRYQVYRELVFERMFEVLMNICPVARSILSKKEWTQVVWDFLRHAPPQSVILRQLPWELAQYLKSHIHPLS